MSARSRTESYLRAVLERPPMYVGPSIQAFEVVLLNLLNLYVLLVESHVVPKEVLRQAYLLRSGASAGAGGPASKLIERYGDDPSHRDVRGFYTAFTEAVLTEVEQSE